MQSIGFLGTGYAVPAHVRTNEDPIFEPLRRTAGRDGELSLFYGNRERRCLAPGESLVGLSAQAGRAALADAGVDDGSIDRLYGYLSVSEYIVPNGLYAVHREMGLGPKVMVVPVQSEFSNFVLSAVLASEAIQAGRTRQALILAGGGWTRNMDYTQGHSIGIGDGAGAALLGRSDRLVLVDWDADTFSDEYGAMAMRQWPDKHLDYPTYGIDPSKGIQAFMSSGMNGPPQLVKRLLAKNGVRSGDVTLISHQATRKLMDHWAELIQPGAYLDTFEEYGNMAVASVPVTLARFSREIRTPWLVMVSVGIGAHQMAVLVRV